MVSVIIPYWNREKYLEFLLASVEKQMMDELEILLVDDGSSDSSLLLCKKWKNKMLKVHPKWNVVLLSQPHLNQSAAVNNAISKVNGDMLFWVDSDDILSDNILLKMSEILANNERFGMVRCNAGFFRNTTDDVYKLAFEEKEYDTKLFDDLFEMKAPCLAGTFMLKTDLLRRIYPDLLIPISDCGQNLQILLPVSSITECYTIPDIGLYYRQHADSDFHMINTLKKACKRNEDLYALYMKLIPMCNCDADKYKRKATEIRELNMKRMIRDIIGGEKND